MVQLSIAHEALQHSSPSMAERIAWHSELLFEELCNVLLNILERKVDLCRIKIELNEVDVPLFSSYDLVGH